MGKYTDEFIARELAADDEQEDISPFHSVTLDISPDDEQEDISPFHSVTLDISPDEAAKRNRLINETGLSPETVDIDPGAVEDAILQKKNRELLKSAPATQKFMENPANAAVASDAVESMSNIEGAWNAVGRAFKRGWTRLELAGAAEQATYAAEKAEPGMFSFLDWHSREYYKEQATLSFQQAGDIQKILSETPMSKVSTDLAEQLSGKSWAEASGIIAANPLSTLAFAMESLPEVVPAVAIGAATTAATKNPYAGAVAAGSVYGKTASSEEIVSFLQERGVDLSDREQALSIVTNKPLLDEARARGFTIGAIAFAVNTATGGLAAKVVGGRIANALVQAGAQTAGGGVEEAAGQAVRTGKVSDPGSVLLSAVAELATTPLDVAAVGRSYFDDHKKAEQAKDLATRMDATKKEFDASPLTQRDPATAAAQVAVVLRENGIEEVAIPVAVLDELGDETVYAGVEDQLDNARATGGDVLMDVDTFAENVIAGDNYDKLKKSVRFTQDGMTAEEAEQFDTGEVPPAAETPLDEATREMGYQSMFSNAKDAGVSEERFKEHLASLAQAKQKAVNAVKIAELKEKDRALTSQWKKEHATDKEIARQKLLDTPLYAAINLAFKQGVDPESLLDAGVSLPSQWKGMGKEGGVSVEILADLFGFDSGADFLQQVSVAPAIDTSADAEATTQMEAKYGTLKDHRIAIQEAIEELHNTEMSSVIQAEHELLTGRKVSQKEIRAEAKRTMSRTTIRLAGVKNFLDNERRSAKAAGAAVRKGDREAAGIASLQRLINFNLAQLAPNILAKIAKDRAFFARFSKAIPGLPVEYQDIINGVLGSYGLSNVVSFDGVAKLNKFIENKAAEGIFIPPPVLPSPKVFSDMTISEWDDFAQSIRAINDHGRNEKKMSRETEKRTRQQVVSGITENFGMSAASPNPLVAVPRELSTYILTPVTVMREMDGGKELGPAYMALQDRIDAAVHRGYRPGQKGLVARQEQNAAAIVKLNSVFTGEEMNSFHTKAPVKGVPKPMSRAERVGVLLNLGNPENRQALIDSKQFTSEELGAIVNASDKKDLDYAQSVWDYIETYWPEVEATTVRRTNVRPEKVEIQGFSTPYGEYAGGYYPIRRVRDPAHPYRLEDLDTMRMKALTGGLLSSHTKNGHTVTRLENVDRDVDLDLGVLNSHMDQVIYDLEMGDAVLDVFKILHNPELKGKFKETGQVEKWVALDSWIKDVVTGELARSDRFNSGFRHVRTGFSISRLAFNTSTAVLQYTGLLHTAAVIGKVNTAKGVSDVISMGLRGKNPMKFVESQTPFMAQHLKQMNSDVVVARTQMQKSFLNAVTPREYQAARDEAFFYFITQTQRHVDTITWLGAKRKGLDMFKGDNEKANLYADSAVKRAQGSGFFHNRNAMERGTIPGSSIQQQEAVKMFTTFYNYYGTKANLLYTKGKETNYKSPLEVANMAVDLLLITVVESSITAIMYGQLPEDDEDEETSETARVAKFLVKKTASDLMGTIPVAREFISAANGFAPGGALGAFFKAGGEFLTQVGQGEADRAAVRSAINVLGVAAKLPSAEPNRLIDIGTKITGKSETEDSEEIPGEWPTLHEALFGVNK